MAGFPTCPKFPFYAYRREISRLLGRPARDLPPKRARVRHQADVGLRSLPNGAKMLPPNLRTREHGRRGSLLSTPCFCDPDTLGSAGICPIRDFWRIVKDSARRGQPLFPFLLSRNVDRIPMCTLKTWGADGGATYSAHTLPGSCPLFTCSAPTPPSLKF